MNYRLLYSITVDDSTNRTIDRSIDSQRRCFRCSSLQKMLADVTSKVKSNKTLKSKINLFLLNSVILIWL